MYPFQRGAFRLFRVAGIQVSLHWLWFLMAFYQLYDPPNKYSSRWWNVAEYLSLFAIVLLHEFGHALACRSVGGKADYIMLWPLGGVAFVDPPPRPGAVLWSIVAGPLVNVLLVPLTLGPWLYLHPTGFFPHMGADVPDWINYIGWVAIMNLMILIFNILPIYPLDGGQILQSLLWFVIGRAESLLAVSVLGLVGGGGLLLLSLLGAAFGGGGLLLLSLMFGFISFRSWAGIRQARAMLKIQNAPRHKDLACPSCGAAPVQGDFWICNACRERFDMFEEQGVCPGCGREFLQTPCPECRQLHPVDDWFAVATPVDPASDDAVV